MQTWWTLTASRFLKSWIILKVFAFTFVCFVACSHVYPATFLKCHDVIILTGTVCSFIWGVLTFLNKRNVNIHWRHN